MQGAGEVEIWVTVPGHDGRYEASSLGRVRSLDRFVRCFREGGFLRKGKILAQHDMGEGYLYVGLGRKKVATAAVICAAFHGPRPPGMEAAHRNGVRSDNSSGNLQWLTKKQNAADKKAHGTQTFGDSHPHSKLNSVLVAEIRSRLSAGENHCSIARDIGIVSRTAIRDIAAGRTWLCA